MKKKMVEQVKVTKAAVKKIVEAEGSKSGKMKQLFDMGMEVKEIAKTLDVRYNFVYNVVSNYAMMNGMETETQKRGGKKERIIELYKLGKTRKEIAIELKTNYNYVYNVLKNYGKKEESK